jgi:hypothetical protein
LLSLSTAGIIDNRAKLPPVTLDVTVHRRNVIDNGSKFTASVVGTGGKFTACVTAISANLGKGVTAGVSRRYQRRRWSICRQCRFHQWCTLNGKYLRERKKFEKALRVLLAREKMRFSDREIPEPNSDAAAATCHAFTCCQLSLLNSLPIYL